MRTGLITAAAVAFVAAAFMWAPPAHAFKNAYYIGTITHVSTDNIKVKNKTGTELSFLIVPKFKNILSDDGKTTYQMSFLHPGTKVEVIYDQKLAGQRHADKIIVLHH